MGALVEVGGSAKEGGGRVLQELEGFLGVKLSAPVCLSEGEGGAGGVDERWAGGGELGMLVHLAHGVVGVVVSLVYV